MTERKYASFAAFYPFYLSEHQNPTCRRLHVAGSALTLAILAYAVVTATWMALLLLPVVGYGFAWVGHYVFEKNRPATFTNPVFSLMGDWVMFSQVLRGKLKF